MLKIKQIQIKNFRSIIKATLSLDQMNIFVGLNDAGKSNILKALNLFFNDEVEPGVHFNFENDYCKFAPEIAKKAKEIEIKITFSIPYNYTDNKDVTWTKVWRKDGKIKDEKDRKFTAYSKLPTLFSRVKYKYVPAVKSNDYFKYLLTDLYKSISNEVGGELVSKTKEYSDTLDSYTSRIGKIVKENVGIDSGLRLPNDQADIFKALVFMTSNSDNYQINLSQRGDGIKSMHIPAILKYIAEHDQNIQEKRSIPVTTIWGYEEPENGIELLKSYDLSNELYNFSNDVQMLITTHSPAFYNLINYENTKVFFASKDTSDNQSIFEENITEKTIHNKIGLMPLISPIISETKQKLKEYEDQLKNGLYDIDTIMVEGKTDKKYIEKAISIYSEFLKTKIDNNQIRIFCSETDGGTQRLLNLSLAWIYTRYKHKCIVITDNDEAGRTLISNFKENKMTMKKTNKNNENVKMIKIPYDEELITCIKNKTIIAPSYTIEDLLPISFFIELDKKNMLENRPIKQLEALCPREQLMTKSIKKILDDLNIDKNVVNLKLAKCVKDENKEFVCQQAILKYNSGESEMFSGFQKLVKELEKIFI